MRPSASFLIPVILSVTTLATGGCRDVVDALRPKDGGMAMDMVSETIRDAVPETIRDGGDAGDRDPCSGGMVTDGACGPTVWPNDISFTNSDPWLREHHDQLLSMRPRVLLLDFYNGMTTAEIMTKANTLVSAVTESSRYHGYSDATAPAFMQYQIVKAVDLKDRPTGTPGGSSLVPADATGAFDAKQLFTSQMYTDKYAFPDPLQPGRNLTLCELFEQGKVNEVWMAVGEDPPRGPLVIERKQMYDADAVPRAGMFACAGGSACLPDEVGCKVTVRLAHLTPVRGVTCDVEIRGFPFESEGMFRALPSYAANAAAFTNADFSKRFSVSFDSWYDICDSSTNICITYPTATTARGTDRSGVPFMIDPFIQGCGSARFPANARFRNDFSSPVTVQSRCEHFGLKDGTNAKDIPDMFSLDTLDKVRAATTQFGTDCGGAWQFYLRQNMPGLRNRATGDDGQPMRNWWPYLFY